jgi:hypothetical protein
MESRDPVAATVDLQRRAIREGMEAVAAGIERTGATQRRALERSRRRTHAALDAVEAVVPGVAVEGTRDTVDGTVGALLDTHAEAVDALVADYEAGAETADSLFEASLAAVEAARFVPPGREPDRTGDADAARQRISEVQKRAAEAVEP